MERRSKNLDIFKNSVIELPVQRKKEIDRNIIKQLKMKIFKVGNFKFPSKEIYENMKEIDRDVDIILSDLNDEEEMKIFFNKINQVLVFEKYFDSHSSMMNLFPNIKKMLSYYSYGENEILKKKYEFASMFLRKFSFTGE